MNKVGHFFNAFIHFVALLITAPNAKRLHTRMARLIQAAMGPRSDDEESWEVLSVLNTDALRDSASKLRGAAVDDASPYHGVG